LSFFGTGSVTLSGVATGTLNGTGANNRVSLTFTPTAGSLTLTVSGSVTLAQLEQSAFATDYIPNASTVASASAGADDLQIAASSLPASGPIVFIADLPAQALPSLNSRIFDHLNTLGIFMPVATEVSVIGTGAPQVTGLTAGTARRVVLLYTPSGASKISVNGSAVATGTDTAISSITNPVFIGNRAGLDRPLNASHALFAAYPGNPSDAQLQAMSAL
jgi:hypothetical protein